MPIYLAYITQRKDSLSKSFLKIENHTCMISWYYGMEYLYIIIEMKNQSDTSS